MIRALLPSILLLPLLATAATVLHSVPLKHRLAGDIAELIRPIAPAGVSVIAAEGQLLLRGEEAQVSELTKVINKLDVAPQSLRISVRHSGETAATVQGIAVGATGGKPMLQAFAADNRDNPDSTHQLQTLEGQWARIQTGSSLPVSGRTIVSGPKGAVIQQGTGYKDVSSGFEVRPRLAGDRVILELRAYQGKWAPGQDGASNTAQLQSTLSAKLGEWVEVAGILENARQEAHGTVFSTRSREQRQSRFQIKIERIP